MEIKEHSNKHAGKAVEHLYAMVYGLTGCQESALESGNTALADTFGFYVKLARMAVDELNLLDNELNRDMNTSSTPGGSLPWGNPGQLNLETSSPLEPLAYRRQE